MRSCDSKFIGEKQLKMQYTIYCVQLYINIYTADRYIKPGSNWLEIRPYQEQNTQTR